jgi:hypothetical protein
MWNINPSVLGLKKIHGNNLKAFRLLIPRIAAVWIKSKSLWALCISHMWRAFQKTQLDTKHSILINKPGHVNNTAEFSQKQWSRSKTFGRTGFHILNNTGFNYTPKILLQRGSTAMLWHCSHSHKSFINNIKISMPLFFPFWKKL